MVQKRPFLKKGYFLTRLLIKLFEERGEASELLKFRMPLLNVYSPSLGINASKADISVGVKG